MNDVEFRSIAANAARLPATELPLLVVLMMPAPDEPWSYGPGWGPDVTIMVDPSRSFAAGMGRASYVTLPPGVRSNTSPARGMAVIVNPHLPAGRWCVLSAKGAVTRSYVDESWAERILRQQTGAGK